MYKQNMLNPRKVLSPENKNYMDDPTRITIENIDKSLRNAEVFWGKLERFEDYKTQRENLMKTAFDLSYPDKFRGIIFKNYYLENLRFNYKGFSCKNPLFASDNKEEFEPKKHIYRIFGLALMLKSEWENSEIVDKKALDKAFQMLENYVGFLRMNPKSFYKEYFDENIKSTLNAFHIFLKFGTTLPSLQKK